MYSVFRDLPFFSIGAVNDKYNISLYVSSAWNVLILELCCNVFIFIDLVRLLTQRQLHSST